MKGNTAKDKEQDWIYVSQWRRYTNTPQHRTQLYFEGKWVEIDTDMTSMVEREEEKWILK